ncbi:MAG: hypothetical protein QM656_08480 [Paracoccaceae bacterium]
MTPEDLRAAVQAGIVTEAQAASLKTLAEARAGQRAAMPAEDEPFEFFRGFSEIFVSLGLVILLSGVAALLALIGGLTILTVVPLGVAAVAWWWAGYFTLKRRMNLPSMVLAVAFGGGIWLAVFSTLALSGGGVRGIAVLPFVVAAGAMALWYRRFRLPFSMFVLGSFALGALYAATASVDAVSGFVDGAYAGRGFMGGFFDLRESPAFATATLIFGIACFTAGMWFDTRDRYRLGRHAATAFWLHLMAAPALVNTVALTLYNTGGGAGIGLLTVALLVIALLALVIDRRSFLSAAIAYIAIVIGWIVGEAGNLGSWTVILLALGALITAVGTWWVPLRRAVMRALPDFPGKDRLPPWA